VNPYQESPREVHCELPNGTLPSFLAVAAQHRCACLRKPVGFRGKQSGSIRTGQLRVPGDCH
jgi:hypothetical protein